MAWVLERFRFGMRASSTDSIMDGANIFYIAFLQFGQLATHIAYASATRNSSPAQTHQPLVKENLETHEKKSGDSSKNCQILFFPQSTSFPGLLTFQNGGQTRRKTISLLNTSKNYSSVQKSTKFCTANDPRAQMIPRPEMIPKPEMILKLDRK